MKNVYFVVLAVLVLFICSCNQTFKVSETIMVQTTTDSVDFDYQKLHAAVLGLNRVKLHEEICSKYPDVALPYIEQIEIGVIKRTMSRSKEIGNVHEVCESSSIGVEISMRYDIQMEEQAALIVQDYKYLLVGQLVRSGIEVVQQ